MPRKTNKYIEEDGYYRIELYKSFTYDILDYAFISECDYKKAKKIFWHKTRYGYARGYNKKTDKQVLLHVYLFDTDTETTILDHKNRNKLDCRRENLRIADKQLNSLNRDSPNNSTTTYKGVSFDERRNKYRTYVKFDQKQIWLGYYDNLFEAVKARENYEKKYLSYV